MFRCLKYLACFLALVLQLGTYAQQEGFTAGLLFNANGIQIEGQDVDFWSGSRGEIWGTGGISMGGYVKRNFSDHLYASLELRYIRKGSIYEFLTDYGLQAYELLKLNYVEMPVLIGYIYRPNKKYRFFETGFAVSKLFSSELALNELTQRKGTPQAADFKPLDFTWIGSMKFPLNRKKADNLFFTLRVEHSLFSIHQYYRLYNFNYGIQIDFLI